MVAANLDLITPLTIPTPLTGKADRLTTSSLLNGVLPEGN